MLLRAVLNRKNYRQVVRRSAGSGVECDGRVTQADLLAVGGHDVFPGLDLGWGVVLGQEVPIACGHDDAGRRHDALESIDAPSLVGMRTNDNGVLDVGRVELKGLQLAE